VKEKDISKMVDMAKNLNINEDSLDRLKDAANKKGVMGKAEELEREIAPKFQEFINNNGDLGNLSNEEKARLILDYKEKLSKEEQKQFDKVLDMLKSYVKKTK